MPSQFKVGDKVRLRGSLFVMTVVYINKQSAIVTCDWPVCAGRSGEMFVTNLGVVTANGTNEKRDYQDFDACDLVFDSVGDFLKRKSEKNRNKNKQEAKDA